MTDALGVEDFNIGYQNWRFPEGTLIERSPNGGFYIYDLTGKRRWSCSSFTSKDNEKTIIIELACRVGRSWHRLIDYTKVWNATTGDLLCTAITVNVLYDANPYKIAEYDDSTSCRRVDYNSNSDGTLSPISSAAYSGPRSSIVSDLKQHHALATTMSELPFQIDVESTGQNLFEMFANGQFDTPEFVLPQPDTVTELGSILVDL